MADDKDNKLLNEIKNYLEITWDDSLGDEKMRGMVKKRNGCHKRKNRGVQFL